MPLTRKTITAFALALATGTGVAASGQTPTESKPDDFVSPKANEAKVAYGAVMKKAEAEYFAAAEQARKAYVEKLQDAMKAVLKAEKPDLTEANRIDAMIKDLEAKKAALPSPPPPPAVVRADDVVGKTFTFGALTNLQTLTFNRDGTVRGNTHANESHWAIVSGQLRFFDDRGRLTTIYNSIARGAHGIMFSGQYQLGDIRHVLIGDKPAGKPEGK